MSVVKSHLRERGITNTAPITLNTKHKAEGNSLAHHALHVTGNQKTGLKPLKHVVNVDKAKVQRSGENLTDVIKHELNHVVDAELAHKTGNFKKPTDTFSKTKQGKALLKKAGLRKGKNKRRSAKEIFADHF